MRLAFMSACLYNYHQAKKKKKTIKEALFFKIKMPPIPIKISSLSILSDSYTSKNMLGTSNFWYGGIFKAIKKTC